MGILKTNGLLLIALSAALLLASCADSRSCRMSGSTVSPSQLCVDYTGSGWDQDGAGEDCTARYAAYSSSCSTCSGGFDPKRACDQRVSETVVSTCQVKAGDPAEISVTYYSAVTPTEAQSHCQSQGGIASGG